MKPAMKSLLFWGAAHFGYADAEQLPTIADMDRLSREQTVKPVPQTVKREMLRAATCAWRGRGFVDIGACSPSVTGRRGFVC
jgi:hypothetical protein